MFTIRLVRWLGWVFETQERKKERKINEIELKLRPEHLENEIKKILAAQDRPARPYEACKNI